MKILLINPNTSQATTDQMAAIARECAPGITVVARPARFGASLITTAEQVAVSAEAVLDLVSREDLEGFDGVIIAAFADPALAALRARLTLPVTGIAEASMMAAGADGRPFAVATTTPYLAGSINSLARQYGFAPQFRGVFLIEGETVQVMNDPEKLDPALKAACARALEETDAGAVIIGGGPLALAARRIARNFDVPIIEPIPAAMDLAVRRASAREIAT